MGAEGRVSKTRTFFGAESSRFDQEAVQAALPQRQRARQRRDSGPILAGPLRMLLVHSIGRQRAYRRRYAVRLLEELRMAAARTGATGRGLRTLPDGGRKAAPYGRPGAARGTSSPPGRAHVARRGNRAPPHQP